MGAIVYSELGSSSDRERWLQLRRSGIGASEIAATLGESPWLSAIELYAQKIGLDTNTGLDDAEHIYWGNQLEAAIVAGYQHRTGRPVEHQGKLLRSVDHPWALCTLDALTTDGREGDPWPLEIKNVGVQKAHEWEDGPPRHYVAQLHHQMLVTNAQRATAAALIGGQRMVWCDVERDEILIRRIIHAGRTFWERCVEAGKVPRPDDSESARRGLAALYKTIDPEKIEQLPASMLDADAELIELKATIKALGKRADQIENDIRAHLGHAEYGVLPDGTRYSWCEQSRAAYVAKAATFRVLRRHKRKSESG
jgi:putative phage-type endonuclease